MNETIEIPPPRVLRHILSKADREAPARCRRVRATDDPPVFKGDFYLANIATEADPLLLELRLVAVTKTTGIALLMTNERYPRDLGAMATRLLEAVGKRDIPFEGVIAPETLGSKLTQAIADQLGPWTLHTTLQKGKLLADGSAIGPPKSWVDEDASQALSSGTTWSATTQKLYLDQAIARPFQKLEHGVLLVDDARLSSGTVTASLALLEKMKVKVAAVATVLNEHDAVSSIGTTPYVWLTKLPLFDRADGGGWNPRPGTYDGLAAFWIEEPA